MTTFPTTYNSESAWKEQQTTLMSQEMETLNTFDTATSQLLYIMTVLAPSLGESASDSLAWRARDENVVSQVFDTDITTITNCYNDDISGAGAPQNVEDVDTAMGAANQMLWYAFTCPPFSDNTDLQTVFVNSLSDLFCVDPVTSTYYVTVDGTTQQIAVPQFDPNGTQYHGMANDDVTAEYWTGGVSHSGNDPSNEGYQSYLTQQSGWNQDLTMMSDASDNLDTQMQAMMQQNETMQKNLDSLWNEMIQEKNKGISSQIEKQISR